MADQTADNWPEVETTDNANLKIVLIMSLQKCVDEYDVASVNVEIINDLLDIGGVKIN